MTYPLLASKKHFIGMLLLVLALGVGSHILVRGHGAAGPEHISNSQIYLGGLAVEWIFFLYVFLGIRRGPKTIRQIIDQSRWSVTRFALYVVIAIGAALVWMLCGVLLGKVLHPDANDIRSLQGMLPGSPVEKTIWILLSVSSGFCEEFVYRGYLQQQFRQVTGSEVAAVVLQAVAFGVAHAALPWKIVIPVTCLAVLWGALAAWRKSLVPGMIMHAGFDLLAGLFPHP